MTHLSAQQRKQARLININTEGKKIFAARFGRTECYGLPRIKSIKYQVSEKHMLFQLVTVCILHEY